MVISIARNMSVQHLNSVLNTVWRRLIFCLYIFYALSQAIFVWINKMYSFNPEQPKWDQSLQSHHPISETAAIIQVLFIWDSPWAFILMLVCLLSLRSMAVLVRCVNKPRWAKPGGVLPYMGYIGMCRCEGYDFQAVYSGIGYIIQRVWV